MLNWMDVIKFAKKGNPQPDRYVIKTKEEWKNSLTPEQYYITREHGTERAFTGEYCAAFEPAIYGCVCCGNVLFDSREKFESGTGWPSFTQPLKENAIKYIEDRSYGMRRIETRCNVCDAHLGHVFPDGPMPSGLRYCMNSAALKKIKTVKSNIKTAVFGGGCFWCTEVLFQELDGVQSVISGYSGGHDDNPTYQNVCAGITGHAEVIQVTYDADVISFEDLIEIHLHTHNPTTLNQQGADRGTQYRSIIFYQNEEEKNRVAKVLKTAQADFKTPIVTELQPLEKFFAAEAYHQNYYNRNSFQPYCMVVISPKLRKLRKKYASKLKKAKR